MTSKLLYFVNIKIENKSKGNMPVMSFAALFGTLGPFGLFRSMTILLQYAGDNKTNTKAYNTLLFL